MKIWTRAHDFFGRHRRLVYGFVVLCICGIGGGLFVSHDAHDRYTGLLSVVIFDRNGIPIGVVANNRGHYGYTLSALPHQFTELLLKKEDRYFFIHPGINPLSMTRALLERVTGKSARGGSTITLQLAKILLGTESDRTVAHKIQEIVYALGIELFTSKDEILTMYSNVVFLGNQIQGFETASRAYFGKALKDTNETEQLLLLATLSHPNARNPWKDTEQIFAKNLHEHLIGAQPYRTATTTTQYAFQDDALFELRSVDAICIESCTATIDSTVTRAVRNILDRHIERERSRGARNGAVVVIDPRRSEIIALVGTPTVGNMSDGAQINMAIEPRPIGSTIKPFIYLEGFRLGLRPYTIVDDREYRYPIATGFPLYPKNYDGTYRGEVTLHEALSNSLNVPSVKILEYIGLERFYTFLLETLRLDPIQDLDEYQYGIALGGLETDLLTLTHYFSVFPRGGTIAPLRLFSGTGDPHIVTTHAHITTDLTVTTPEYTELVHAILSDRLSGVDQFGLESTLNLPTTGYGVKTGTSRDFHDSWVVGYTGDFVVGVWIGNSENEALEQISGQSGAGAIWHDVMEYLLASPYNKKTQTPLPHLTHFPLGKSEEWGLLGDRVDEHIGLLTKNSLVTSIHQDDTFAFTENSSIPLRSKRSAVWYANGIYLGNGNDISFTPPAPGGYEIMAVPETGDREIIRILITEEVKL